MQNEAVQLVVKSLKEANNVLVTVRNNPSVDELAGAIALTLILNHLNKHATTVFSGRVPSTLEFLQPDMAINANTDSLRDFIIALDKSKADKLRYKVEDNVVRIFITPYKTSINEKDLEFSQGDFNVDVVVALGVVTVEDFDQAITAHGRILHDATVVSVTKQNTASQIGAIKWQDLNASSVSEMITGIVDQLGGNVLDGQIATALLTGIVSETDRFKNANTTPQVLSYSSKLMTAGANQQLIAEKLEEPDTSMSVAPLLSKQEKADGTLEIAHEEDAVQNINIDDSGNLNLEETKLPEVGESDQLEGSSEKPNQSEEHSYVESSVSPKMYGEDDSGQIAAQPLFDTPNSNNPNTPSSLVQNDQTLQHNRRVLEPLPENTQEYSDYNVSSMPISAPPVVPIQPLVDHSAQTLSDLEQAVDSPHVDQQPNGSTVDDFLGTTRQVVSPDPVVTTEPPEEVKQRVPEPPVIEVPPELQEEVSQEPQEPIPQVIDSTAPPSVPPPLMPQATNQPQFFDADGNSNNPFLNPS